MASAPTSRRMDAGSLLIAAGAIVLLVSLFLDWYGAEDAFGDAGADAWRVFELIDLLLAAVALTALVAVGERFLSRGRANVPDRVLDALGPVALVLVLYALIDEPPIVLVSSEASPEAGAWLALGAAIAMALGAFLRGARVALVIDRDAAAPTAPSGPPATETHPTAAPTEPLARRPEPPLH